MRSLLWKEWRETWVFLPVGALLVSACLLIGQHKVGGYDWNIGITVAECVLCLFAILVPSGLIAGECEGGTLPFLTSLPVSCTRLFGVKFAVGLLVTEGIAACVATGVMLHARGAANDTLWLIAFVAALAYLSAALVSPWVREPLHAVPLAIFMGGLLWFGLLHVVQPLVSRTVGAYGVWQRSLWGGWVVVGFPVIARRMFTWRAYGSKRWPWAYSVGWLAASFALVLFTSAGMTLLRSPLRTAPETLKMIDSVSVSPDSRSILVTTRVPDAPWGQSAIWIVKPDTGQATFVDIGLMPVWSPDGTQIAYYSDRWVLGLRQPNRTENVWLYSVDRHRRRCARFPRPTVFDDAPAWSPDGRCLLLKGGSIVSNRDRVHFLFSPEGQIVFFAQPAVWILPVQSGRPHVLPVPQSAIRIIGWYSNGNGALVYGDGITPGTSSLYSYDIRHFTCYAVHVSNLDIYRILRSSVRTDVWVIIQHDGTVIFADSSIDLYSGRTRTIRLPAALPPPMSLSPDKRWLVCPGRASGAYRERIVAYDLTNQRSLVFDAQLQPRETARAANKDLNIHSAFPPWQHIAWSADSRQFVFADYGKKTNGRLLMADVTTGKMTPVIAHDAGDAIEHIAWLEADRIVFSRWLSGLWIVNTGGSGLRRIFPAAGKE